MWYLVSQLFTIILVTAGAAFVIGWWFGWWGGKKRVEALRQEWLTWRKRHEATVKDDLLAVAHRFDATNKAVVGIEKDLGKARKRLGELSDLEERVESLEDTSADKEALESLRSEHHVRIVALEERKDDYGAKIIAFGDRLSKVEGRDYKKDIDALRKELDSTELAGRVVSLEAWKRRAADDIEAVSGVPARVEANASALAGLAALATSVASHGESLEDLKSRVEGHDTGIEAIEQRATEHEQALLRTRSRLEAAEAAVEKAQQRASDAEAGLNEHLQGHGDAQAELTSKVNSSSEALAALGADLAMVKESASDAGRQATANQTTLLGFANLGDRADGDAERLETLEKQSAAQTDLLRTLQSELTNVANNARSIEKSQSDIRDNASSIERLRTGMAQVDHNSQTILALGDKLDGRVTEVSSSVDEKLETRVTEAEARIGELENVRAAQDTRLAALETIEPPSLERFIVEDRNLAASIEATRSEVLALRTLQDGFEDRVETVEKQGRLREQDVTKRVEDVVQRVDAVRSESERRVVLLDNLHDSLDKTDARATDLFRRVDALETGMSNRITREDEVRAEQTRQDADFGGLKGQVLSLELALSEYEAKEQEAKEREASLPPDDLKRISGIGPVIERTLNGLGYYRFSQIAGLTTEDINRISSEIDAFGDRIERDDWIGQARQLDQVGFLASGT